ncbi:MAG TPA: PD-(D/E)XK nuclease family protein [Anaerovoracaceae bacterium]|nr:PD-(D/E)XK nuclease family protein [Anaerovoracaceae bacterium]
MLHICYGRENLDKEKFLFDKIAGALLRAKGLTEDLSPDDQKILLLVPDQFTLQAERNAFAYLGVDGLMELEVMSQSRLGFKVLAETGGSSRVPVDKYGRHMLLAKILTEENDRLEAFRGMYQKPSFIEMANNLISEMKQFNASPADVLHILKETETASILHRKLKDIHAIYQKYEELIEGKYLDTEDYLNLFISKIRQSRLIRNSVVWISGFDYFTPKTLNIIEQLTLAAKEVNIVLTADCSPGPEGCSLPPEGRDSDLFDLTRGIIFKLKAMVERNGIQYRETPVDESDLIPVGDRPAKKQPGENPEGRPGEKAAALAHLEQELYAQPYRQAAAGEAITLCQAANFYAEAETAAAKIVRLVREEGLRYRDILVICNDMEARANVIRRVFADYGINAFLDKKRDILHHPSVEFISALIDITAKGWLYEDVFRMLKTNLTTVSFEDCEDLENYAVKYRIKGSRWKSDFTYGAKAEGEEALQRLNEIRKQVCDYIAAFETGFRQNRTVRERTEAIYGFLTETARLPEKIQALMDYLTEGNQFEYAEEASQIWSVIIGIFDQLVELIGEEEISAEEYAAILKAGFEAVEIGLLPPTVDQIIVGTMQRTRAGNIKALIVLGANDGLLPATGLSESLLNEDEKTALYKKGIEICRIDDLRIKEEKLAIYKNLSKPSRYLWMGYSASDLEGKESKPSMLFDKIRKIYTDIKISKDIINEEDPILLIETPGSALRHMTDAFRGAMEGTPLKPEWKAAYRWYENNAKPLLEPVKAGLLFSNKQEKIRKDLIRKLYKGDLSAEFSLSPSRLERFSRCPFSHFVNYGLHPDEQRIFEIAGREIGDVYHQCFMKLSEKLFIPGMDITDPRSAWMSITEEQCHRFIDGFIEEAALEYREGVLIQGEEERYRSRRMKKVCGDAAWALVEHVQTGRIQDVFFESEFGRAVGKQFPPIEVRLGEDTLYIEGKIDRVDVLRGRDGDASRYIKIIDYKSGKEKFDTEEAKAGWRLQLMLYLRAALGANSPGAGQEVGECNPYKPAGVFYFEVAEPQIDVTEATEADYTERVKAERKKSFKLDGVVLDDGLVIESIAGEFSGYSDILPVRKTKEGLYAGTTEKKLLKEEDFSELLEAVDRKVKELCGELAEGSIEIKPKKVKDGTACRYCLYKSICCFDLSFDGCSYDVVK